MSDLYLTRLLVQEFRTFSKCEVLLPAAPGVLLVSGPNGLGKSTLFDGLEWCLSGKVDRFAAAAKGVSEDKYLRRWGALEDRPTCVEASFGEGLSVGRKLIGSEALRTGRDAADVLRSATWREIGDLHNYLLLTHFLGQSTLTRMTHRPARDRWEYLKGPARSDWAKEIGEALHGHGNSAEARAYISAAAAAQETAQRLEELLKTEEAQLEGSRAAGALSEPDIIMQAGQALAQLASSAASTARPASSPLSAQDALESLATAISQLQSEAGRQDAGLKRADALLRRFIEAGTRTEQLQKGLTTASAAAAELKLQSDKCRADVSTRQTARDQARETHSQHERRVAGLQKLRDLYDARARREAVIAALGEELPTLVSDLTHSEERLAAAQRRLGLAQAVDGRRLAVLRQVEDTFARVGMAREVAELDKQIATDRASINELERSLPDLPARLAAARQQLTTAQERREAARRALAGARQAVDQLSAAVVSVAAHIDESTCVCPICASKFEPGELLKRATVAAAALGPTIAPLEAHSRDAEKDVADAEAALGRLSASDAQLTTARQALSTLLDARADLIARFQVIDGEFDAAAEIVNGERVLGALRRRAQRLERWLRVLGDPTVLQNQWSTELLARNAAERRLSERRDAQSLEAKALQHDGEDFQAAAIELGVALPFGPDAIEDLLAQARVARGEASDALSNAERALDQWRTALVEAERATQSAQTHEQQQRALLEAAGTEMEQARTEWAELGISGAEPSQDARAQAERNLQALRHRLMSAEQRLAELRSAYSVALLQDAHREALAQLRRAVAVPSDVDRDEIRRIATEAQEQALLRAQRYNRAQAIAQGAYQEINRRVGVFNRRYLKPLNDLMIKINRAILTDPEVGLELEFDRNAVRQRARRLAKAPPGVAELDPLLVHSEGQMAALAVSMLCAASVTFSWSRWPALIMDDPLQHNDVVHASAFADLMRNLVRERGYQLFLSTHDAGQADFLRRKFVAGGVPCTIVRLVGRGEDGTLIEVQQHLADAA